MRSKIVSAALALALCLGLGGVCLAAGGPIVMGGEVEGTHLTLPGPSTFASGLFFLCDDGEMMDQGSHFSALALQDGVLTPLEERSFSQDYAIFDGDFHIELDYVVYNGGAVFTYVPSDGEMDTGGIFRLLESPSPVNSTPLLFALPDADRGSWPVLLDLETGTVTDPLADSGISIPWKIADAVFSSDRTGLLLRREDGAAFYCDLVRGSLHDLDRLSGFHVDGCVMGKNSLSCWALEGAAGPDQVPEAGGVLRPEDLGALRVWTLSLADLTVRTISSGLPATPGVSGLSGPLAGTEDSRDVTPGVVFIPQTDRTQGGRFALEVDEEKALRTLDLFTGRERAVQDFAWPGGDYPLVQCSLSDGGDRLLICRSAYDDEKDLLYMDLYVLDYTAGQVLRLDTDGMEQIRPHAVYWSGNDQVVVLGDVSDKAAYWVFPL